MNRGKMTGLYRPALPRQGILSDDLAIDPTVFS